MQDYAGLIGLCSWWITVISVCYFVVVDTRIVLFSLQYRFYTICEYRRTVYISVQFCVNSMKLSEQIKMTIFSKLERIHATVEQHALTYRPHDQVLHMKCSRDGSSVHFHLIVDAGMYRTSRYESRNEYPISHVIIQLCGYCAAI